MVLMAVSALGLAAYFWKKPHILTPTPRPTELISSKTLVDFSSLAEEPSYILLSSPPVQSAPAPSPPTPRQTLGFRESLLLKGKSAS